MPAVDFIAHVKRLAHMRDSALRQHILGDRAQWGPDEENRARLLEVQAHQLQLDWHDRVTDLNDPAVIRERDEARRRGIKPPKAPIIPPVALRPDELAEERIREYLDEVISEQTPDVTTQTVSIQEFNRVIESM